MKQMNASYLLIKTKEPPRNLMYAATLKQCITLYRQHMLDFFKPFHAKYAAEDFVHFKNQYGQLATIKLLGTDTNLMREGKQTGRGDTGNGMIGCDEFGDWSPGFLESVVYPQGDEHNCPFLITGTPRGSRHFKDNYYHALARMQDGDPRYGALKWNIEDSLKAGEITRAYFEELKERHKNHPRTWRAEYLLDFDAYLSDIIFGAELDAARTMERIGHFPARYNWPTETYWDVGTNGTAVWFVQRRAGRLFFVGYLEQLSNVTFETFIKERFVPYQEKHNFYLQSHYFPHDMSYKDFSSKKARIVLARQLLGKGCHKLPPVKSPDEHIDIAKRLFFRCYFHEKETSVGLSRLEGYNMKGFKPNKDEHSHGADAFIMALTLDEKSPEISKEPDILNFQMERDRYLNYKKTIGGGYGGNKPWFVV